ncbi:MAG: hypothetical protein NZT61_02330 [Deltaproteobacteria bacterium]|nr:hypothetical protein [Deltaproteobacteria bacterium]
MRIFLLNGYSVNVLLIGLSAFFCIANFCFVGFIFLVSSLIEKNSGVVAGSLTFVFFDSLIFSQLLVLLSCSLALGDMERLSDSLIKFLGGVVLVGTSTLVAFANFEEFGIKNFIILSALIVFSLGFLNYVSLRSFK